MMLYDDIVVALDAQFLWITLSPRNIFKMSMPTTPDLAIGVYQYPGLKPYATLANNAIKLRRPRLQILVRDLNINDAMTKSQNIMDFLAVQTDVVINGTKYIKIEPIGDPGEIGPDTSGRQRVTCNYQVIKEP